MLYGRESEQARIDQLLGDARAGRSGALVLRGEPGVGKSALLDHAAAQGLVTVRSAGVESEAELPFAGLHLLARPAAPLIERLPERQRKALLGAFGVGDSGPGDRLLIGLAVLSLLAEEAIEHPVLCLIDDAHWLDRATAEALLFAARRLDAEGVAILFATRAGPEDFPAPGLPELLVGPLRHESAAALLDELEPDLAPDLRMRALGAAAGNPLALRELPAVLAASAPDEGPNPLPLTQRLHVAFHGQVSRLPSATQSLLLVAAAAGTTEIGPVLTAAARLGTTPADLGPAEELGLIAVDGHHLRLRHPLLRSAIYRGAPLSSRLAAHRALADTMTEPDRADLRSWHLASAATGPDEQIAIALEDTAERARLRSGHHGAVAAYARAAALSTDQQARVRRLVLAAETAAEAGLFESAMNISARAAAQTSDPLLSARLDLVHGSAEFGTGQHLAAHRRLLAAADVISTRQPSLAARILTQAVHAAWYLGEGELAQTDSRLRALSLDDAEPAAPILRWVLAGLYGRSTGDLRAAAGAAGSPRDLVLLCGAGLVPGHDDQVRDLAAELVARCREEGRIGLLPPLLFFLAEAETFLGRPREGFVIATEGARIADDIGQRHWVSQLTAFLAYLAALDGHAEDCSAAVERALAEQFGGPSAAGATWCQAALGMLALGLGRVDEAIGRFSALTVEPARHQVVGLRSLPDLIEAAVRLGDRELAGGALIRLSRWARDCGQPWVRALEQRSRALIAEGPEAGELFEAALGSRPRPFEEGRTRLLYGEWLRRARRKTEARTQLRTAQEIFAGLGASPWAERAEVELRALGEGGAARPGSGPQAALTPQELQIVRLAARGMSNRDIAAYLFLSPRTVGHHLYKAYPKLGVASRGELAALSLEAD
ncbi:helix-turn-helix transcriptional regulator [Nocardia shimofusensis]|uniref:helix-turn-helix transcriptional regulator n=1 Tax=Nocardia shimofusensis TaxID=228596 RepID=UPI00082E5D75|nr:helix-turn-helix transcriptional regulator [Nocardia shimofusensis]